MLIIGGATATGKSELAIKLAKKLNGEIISADSMQIYKGMDIGTAKITASEMDGIPHHLIDIKNPNESFNVAEYIDLAKPIISDLKAQSKLPIIVGGTGLYINALIYDYQLSDENIEVRKSLNEELELNGSDYMYEKLIEMDPISAQKIHKNNVKRVIRALEVYITTNESISNKHDKATTVPHFMYAVEYDRALLYERINKRVDLMFKKGLVDEVKKLIDMGINFNCQSMKAIGYEEFNFYFNGELSLEETKNLIKQHSRNYAKRQLTWFKRIESCEWLENIDIERNIDIICNRITNNNIN
jgi:tRNA dimethylallyltransferase